MGMIQITAVYAISPGGAHSSSGRAEKGEHHFPLTIPDDCYGRPAIEKALHAAYDQIAARLGVARCRITIDHVRILFPDGRSTHGAPGFY